MSVHNPTVAHLRHFEDYCELTILPSTINNELEVKENEKEWNHEKEMLLNSMKLLQMNVNELLNKFEIHILKLETKIERFEEKIEKLETILQKITDV